MAVRAEKRGDRLCLVVDRLPGEPPIEMIFQDPAPLAGDRIAVWTYGHAVMLSRVRISGQGGTDYEDPGVQIEPPRTFYEK
jgi:hypothetical protein